MVHKLNAVRNVNSKNAPTNGGNILEILLPKTIQ